VFEILKPGFDLKAERAKRAAAGKPDTYLPQDLYPDVMDCFAKLRQRGTKLGIAGNQPQTTEAALSAMGAVADVTGSSGRWGCEKPSAEFFNKVIEVADCRPGDIAYVGDRVDHDVVPAHRAGMVAILLRRGPWGTTHAHWPEAALAHVVLESLSELPATIEALRWSGRPR
jgi:FMN phosphatase YigB (HAD superfamily)